MGLLFWNLSIFSECRHFLSGLISVLGGADCWPSGSKSLNQIFSKSLSISSSCRAQPKPGELRGESTTMSFCFERTVPQLQTLASWDHKRPFFLCCDWQEMKDARVKHCNQLSYSSGDPTLLASTGNEETHAWPFRAPFTLFLLFYCLFGLKLIIVIDKRFC